MRLKIILLFSLVPLLSYSQNHVIYSGKNLREIHVPIGGIGAGDILLGGRGQIAYLEFFNRPNSTQRARKTLFTLWTKAEGEEPVTRIMERELIPPYGDITEKFLNGLPRFREARFHSTYPLIRIDLEDEQVPLEFSLEAYSPFIPLDPENSSIPIIIFKWHVKNPTPEKREFSIAFNLKNPWYDDATVNQFIRYETFQGVLMKAQDKNEEDLKYGNVLIATTEKDIEARTFWKHGKFKDDSHFFWNDFSDDGHIEPYTETIEARKAKAWNDLGPDVGTLLVNKTLDPGDSMVIPFYLSWYVPNRSFSSGETFGIQEAAEESFRNHYASRFSSSEDVLSYFLENKEYLEGMTREYARTLFSSTYPDYLKEALSTQSSTLKSMLIQWLENGEVHGFEGVLPNGWCCPGTCTHVWNYEQTLALLFPSLERKTREISFLHDTHENGFQAHRSVIPLGDYWFDGPAAADGQLGNIVRAYRDWKYSGDTEWLGKLWPKVKASLEFAWYGPGEVEDPRHEHQESQKPWDPNKRGILTNMQHNTYDISFYGPNSMTGSIYLAALKAGAEMAEAMGDQEAEAEYRKVYERGKKYHQEKLWNGEYYIQLNENEEPFTAEELENSVYQYGNGCLADQLLGQYLAFNAGLDYLLPEESVRKALSSVYKYNFIDPVRTYENVQRVYALNDEGGVVLCAWPEDDMPSLPFVYAQEVWSGVEYQAAASMIYSGLVEEGLEIVKAVQERHDGHRRNPFAHDESGWHYARAMASGSLLPALSGFNYDGVSKELTFSPAIASTPFRTFWVTGDAWGELVITGESAELKVHYGSQKLNAIQIDHSRLEKPLEVLLNEQKLRKSVDQEGWIKFRETIEVNTGATLVVRY